MCVCVCARSESAVLNFKCFYRKSNKHTPAHTHSARSHNGSLCENSGIQQIFRFGLPFQCDALYYALFGELVCMCACKHMVAIALARGRSSRAAQGIRWIVFCCFRSFVWLCLHMNGIILFRRVFFLPTLLTWLFGDFCWGFRKGKDWCGDVKRCQSMITVIQHSSDTKHPICMQAALLCVCVCYDAKSEIGMSSSHFDRLVVIWLVVAANKQHSFRLSFGPISMTNNVNFCWMIWWSKWKTTTT